jgi:antitoxin (DNA-binding transcriptional repressor) of toxin-antitoxin stability system
MATVSIREARNKFTELARRVEAGERVIVTRNGKPVLELGLPARKGGIDYEAGDRWLQKRGLRRPRVWMSDDFDDPLPEDFLLQQLPDPPRRKFR